jgi:hypothetical protein
MAPAFGLAIQVDSFRAHQTIFKRIIDLRVFIRVRQAVTIGAVRHWCGTRTGFRLL